jgi:hypothetical protein
MGKQESLGAPANPKARCMAPYDNLDTLCGERATEQRVIDDIVFCLCDEHAKQVDAETATET